MTAFSDVTPGARDLAGRSVVFLHAHPDDEAIFTGATMYRLAAAGARVVLVTATAGELGYTLLPLAAGESLARRRLAELEAACDALGVARLVVLGRRDSGMPGWAGNRHPRALHRANVERLAGKLADLCAAERADALVHYDDRGIYGHPDHVAVHQIGARAARRAGIVGYEATVDREHLHFTGAHLVEGDGPRRHRPTVGRPTVEITTALAATVDELAAKRRAMRAHASQIPVERLTGDDFAGTYGLEWYVRRGPAGVVEALGNAHAIA